MRNVDKRKRASLKAIVGVAGLTAIPTSINAACRQGAALVSGATPRSEDVLGAETANVEIDFDNSFHDNFNSNNGPQTGAQRVTVTNNSGERLTLRHVSPGAVSTRHGSFDLNLLLARSPVTVEAGSSSSFLLEPVVDNAINAIVPEPVSSSVVPVAVKTIDDTGTYRVVRTTRKLYV